MRAMLRLADLIRSDIERVGLGPPGGPVMPALGDPLSLYDSLVLSEPLRKATRRLFTDGHYARAVEEAFKLLNNAVKERSGSSKDGADLMRDVFSANSPALKLNDLRSQSQQDEQRGYMDLYAGSMTGIRNPRAHDHKSDDQPQVALELLTMANHLMRKLETAKRARRRKKAAPISAPTGSTR